jgi:hypothetical protein
MTRPATIVAGAVAAALTVAAGFLPLADQGGYSRDKFGAKWADEDHDGCNTREELLARPGPCPPRVLDVTITDPYTGHTVTGRSNVDVDEIVPRAWMWRHGADKWTPRQRQSFANDPTNLVLTSVHENRSKGERGPADYLPPDVSARCWYEQRWEAVLVEYRITLPTTDRDQRTLAQIASYCVATP